MPSYPVNLNIENQLCIVFGGGSVAARKVDSLLQCGAAVRVISPHVDPKIQLYAEGGKIEWLQRGYETGDIDDAFLVLAATDNNDVQQRIAREARDSKVLINVADDPMACSFQVPASVRRGEFLLTISTGGASPALSAKIRQEIEKEYGPEYGQLVDLLGTIRDSVVHDGRTQESHKILFEKLLQLNILTYIRLQKWQALQDELKRVLPADVDIKKLIEVFEIGKQT